MGRVSLFYACLFVFLLSIPFSFGLDSNRLSLPEELILNEFGLELPKASLPEVARSSVGAVSFEEEPLSRVIVTLKDPSLIWENDIQMLSDDSIVRLESLLREHVIQTSSAFKSLSHKFTSFNGFSAELSSSEIERLYASGIVKHIEEDFKVTRFMQDTTELLGADVVWNMTYNGVNLTGKGQTVCVIDDVIDFRHSDLGGCYGNNDPSSPCKVIGGNYNETMVFGNHATHVAGTVAANGFIRGIAPDARLITFDVFDGGHSSDIIAGIDWCRTNAPVFNISVISISLGLVYQNKSSVLRSSDCDDYLPHFSSAIQAATTAGISVVIATGNDGQSDLVGAPACIESAIRVGSTTKGDEVSSFSNRWGLDMLLAPGSSIISTCVGGGICTKNGTSMATPHVSGAIAVINQFLALQGETKTPFEINALLRETGVLIPADQRSYSRINLLSAIQSLFPTLFLTINHPVEDGLWFNTSSVILNSTVSDIFLDSCWWTNNSGITNTTFDCNTEIVYPSVEGEHIVTIFANNSVGELSLATRIFNIDTIVPQITFTFLEQDILQNNSFVFVSMNVTEENLFVAKVNNQSISCVNESSVHTCNGTILVSEPDVLFEVWDVAGNYNMTKLSVTIDDIPPVIENVSLSRDVLRSGTVVTVIVNTTDNTQVASVTANGVSLAQDELSSLWNGSLRLFESPLQVSVIDVAGNVAKRNESFIVDDVLPTLNASLFFEDEVLSPLLWYNHSVFVNITAFDEFGIERIEWRFANETTWNLYDEPFEISSAIPLNRLIYRAVDFAGNTALSKVLPVKVDTFPPIVKNISSNSLVYVPSSQGFVSAKISDSLSGITSVYLTNNATIFNESFIERGMYKIPFIAPSTEKEFNLTLFVRDVAGNVFSQNISLESVSSIPVILSSVVNSSIVSNNTEISFDFFSITNASYAFGDSYEFLPLETTSSASFVFSDMGNDTITFNVTSNGETYELFTFSFIVDVTSPLLTVTPPLNSTGPLRIDFYCVDQESGVSHVDFLMNDTLEQTISSNNSSIMIDSFSYSDGNYTAVVSCFDFAGNVNTTAFSLVINNTIRAVVPAGDGVAFFDDSILQQHLYKMTHLSSTFSNASVSRSDTSFPKASFSIDDILLSLSLIAETEFNSQVYFFLPKDAISPSDFSRLVVFANHSDSETISGPYTVTYVDEVDSRYRFVFETNTFSDFFVGIESVEEPSPSPSPSGPSSAPSSPSPSSAAMPSPPPVTTQEEPVLVPSLFEKELPFTKEIAVLDSIVFSVFSNPVLLTLQNLSEDVVVFTIDSKSFTLKDGELLSLDLIADGRYDIALLVTITSSSSVEFSVEVIEVLKDAVVAPTDTEISFVGEIVSNNFPFSFVIGVFVFFFVIGLLVTIFVKRRRRF